MKDSNHNLFKTYGKNCWMLYTPSSRNHFTRHHIDEKRNGGKGKIHNIAVLTKDAHSDLNTLDMLRDRRMYEELNELFRILSRTDKPPTIEHYKDVNKILRRASKIIRLSKSNNMDIDYGLLEEAIAMANEEGNKRGHLILLHDYLEEGMEYDAWCRGNPDREVIPTGCGEVILLEEDEARYLDGEPLKPTAEDVIPIPGEYVNLFRHGNRHAIAKAK